ncbi:hypothetical protein PYK22_01884 [Pyrinomonas methylaliphatogenes]|uniref:Uncharacterized protein n=1 Tax=Pyrinomonas methylaliphatogenes TaxID=454194 RepID=A0A0B6WXQ0_9BACT|nr:hypothetical protein PYK22_01884 [Pyrinomonas methylaliphatogenes]
MSTGIDQTERLKELRVENALLRKVVKFRGTTRLPRLR